MDRVPIAKLSPDEVNRFLLRKQCLAPGPKADSVAQVMKAFSALHATSPLTPYISLWARMQEFSRESLEAELYETRSLLRLLCMRETLHIVSRESASVFFQATVARSQSSYRRQLGKLLVQAGLCLPGEEAEVLEGLHNQIWETLLERGPSTTGELG